MADDPKDPPAPDPEKDPKPDGDKPPDLTAEVEKWKAMARKHETQAKANADAAKKLQELEDAGKSEVEKATATAAEATKRAEEAELRALRVEVAAEKGLTAVQSKRLVGTNREELEADADQLLTDFPTDNGTKKDPVPGRPTERLKGGGDPTEEPDPDLRKVVADIPRGF